MSSLTTSEAHVGEFAFREGGTAFIVCSSLRDVLRLVKHMTRFIISFVSTTASKK